MRERRGTDSAYGPYGTRGAYGTGGGYGERRGRRGGPGAARTWSDSPFPRELTRRRCRRAASSRPATARARARRRAGTAERARIRPGTRRAIRPGRGVRAGVRPGGAAAGARRRRAPGWLATVHELPLPETDAARLERLIALPGAMSPAERAVVDRHTCWPVARIVSGGRTTG
ncbi:hypothetical protein NKH77_36930 [Streptomyces sp. M19]